MTTITICNTKGGTGKTTTTLNLATELGLLSKKVLLIDLDPQSSLSKAILGENDTSDGIETLLTDEKIRPMSKVIQTKITNVKIIPSHSKLSESALKLLMNTAFFALKDVLRQITDFDFILIDTQPSKNILMLNSFSAADFVIIPTNPGVYPLMDIVELEDTIKKSSRNSNPNLQILGVLITMVQRGTVYKQLETDLRKYFHEKVFKTTISRLVKSEESAVEGVGVSLINSDCKLSHQYKSLTTEILNRLEV